MCVAGIGVAGLRRSRGAAVAGRARSSWSTRPTGPASRSGRRCCEILGAQVRLGDGDTLPDGIDLLVVSPGLPAARADHRGRAGRRRAGLGRAGAGLAAAPRDGAAPWLVVTGTNGKTTTTLMLESMLRAAGLRTVAAGNIGVSLVEVVMAEATPEGALDVIAVEVGAPQLPFLHSMSPQASVCLNIAEDHVDLFGIVRGLRGGQGAASTSAPRSRRSTTTPTR